LKFSDFFAISFSELKGVFILILIIFILILSPGLIFQYLFNPRSPNTAADIRKLDSLVKLLDISGQKIREPASDHTFSKSKQKLDPNTASYEQLRSIGFRESTAKSIISYRKAGGYFKEPSDIEKLYTITPEEIERTKSQLFHKEGVGKREIHSRSLNINKVEASELLQLPGIGKVFSERMIKYRNLLGGYTSVVQLKEIYGIEDSLFQSIERYFYVSGEDSLRGIDVNVVSMDRLYSHPYINKYTAGKIIASRTVDGPFNTLADLTSRNILDSLTLERLKPYLIITPIE
jgi:DNA uptake protein ComE-like DNA-binding protein